MQEFKNEEFHLKIHEELENREASLELREVMKNNCKLCGQEEHKNHLCSSCYSEHKSEVVSRLGFIGGWLIGAGIGAFIVSNLGAFVITLGISGGIFGFQISKTLVSKNSSPNTQ